MAIACISSSRPGVTVTDGSQNSIKDFAGYHDVFQDSAGAAVYYAVIPYPTGNVSSLPLTNFQQETLVLSHEIAEAVTDPDTQGGWFDGRSGEEIGDIAEGTSGMLNGYVVQGVWSQIDRKNIIPSGSTNTSLEVEGTHLSATTGQSFSSIVATITGVPASDSRQFHGEHHLGMARRTGYRSRSQRAAST